MNRGVVRLVFPSASEAETARRALEPDNEGHVTVRVEGSHLVVETSSETRMGVLRSLDDVLGCLRAAGLE